MGYAAIEIREVGEAEFPLIQVLRETIFNESGHVIRATFAQQIAGRTDVLALMAHLEGNPVGYKVGYREGHKAYHSWTGGVLKDYRGQGIARRMQEWQHAWARSRGYERVGFNTFNKFRAMILFGLDTGFLPDGVEVRHEGELSIHFTKDLKEPDVHGRIRDVSRLPGGTGPVALVDRTNTTELARHIRAGFDFVGLARHPDQVLMMMQKSV